MFNSSSKKDYNKKFQSVMSVFTKAQEEAQQLITEMESEMDSNIEAINRLQERNAEIKKTHQGTKKFIENISNLLKV